MAESRLHMTITLPILVAIVSGILGMIGSGGAALWYIGTWNGKQIERTDEYVKFRDKIEEKIEKMTSTVVTMSVDLAEVRGVVCTLPRSSCRSRSAAEMDEEIKRASVK